MYVVYEIRSNGIHVQDITKDVTQKLMNAHVLGMVMNRN